MERSGVPGRRTHMLAENSYFCEPNWPTLSSTVLPGGYEVSEIVEAQAQRARFRVRVLGDWSANAFADAFCTSASQVQEQVALWMAAKELQHPNLISPFAAGELDHEGAALIYVVVPGADENLAGVLRDRALTGEEAREILVSLRRALEYLHAHGWVHGHLSPEQVLAVGDSIRISSEYAGKINAARPLDLATAKYVAPEAISGNITPPADIWCLGATIFETLTQKVFSADRLSEVSGLPQPFDKVVERCLDPNPQSRCTLMELSDLLANRRITPPIQAPIPPVASLRQEAAPLVARVARPRQPVERTPKLWIYAAALGVFVVLLLLWAARPKHQYLPATTQVVATKKIITSDAVARAPKNNMWETKTFTPDRNAPRRNNLSAPSRAEKTGQQDPPAVNGSVWRVVVFTYAHQPDAANKAHLVNQRHPNLDATVFSPPGHGSLYLVTVGGKLTREEAARLRQYVIGLGLPRDSYIQNYRQ